VAPLDDPELAADLLGNAFAVALLLAAGEAGRAAAAPAAAASSTKRRLVILLSQLSINPPF
jgi:hypothetical protein